MCSKTVSFILLLIELNLCVAFLNDENEIEARGKKKKIALFVYFADLVVKKIFVLKLIYAFVFWLVLHKAGYFLGWFISYLKEKKHEFHHDDHHHHYGYGPSHGPTYGHSYGPSYGHSYESSYGSSYGPYRRQTQGQ